MTWIPPKTDWISEDGVTANDANRIEGNIFQLSNDVEQRMLKSINNGISGNIAIFTGQPGVLGTQDVQLVKVSRVVANITTQSQLDDVTASYSWSAVISAGSTLAGLPITTPTHNPCVLVYFAGISSKIRAQQIFELGTSTEACRVFTRTTLTTGVWGPWAMLAEVEDSFLYKKPLNFMSWEEIDLICSLGLAEQYWSIGDEKDVTLSTGEVLTFQIYDFGHDDLFGSGGKASITFGMKNLMSTIRALNPTGTNIGGLVGSALNTWLQGTLYNSLPADLQAVTKLVNKRTSAGNLSTTISNDGLKMFLFSEIEIFGLNTNSVAGEGTQYPIFVTAANRIKKVSNGLGSANSWWGRSPVKDNTTSFCYVSASGVTGRNSANISLGVCLGFCVGSKLDDRIENLDNKKADKPTFGNTGALMVLRTTDFNSVPNDIGLNIANVDRFKNVLSLAQINDTTVAYPYTGMVVPETATAVGLPAGAYYQIKHWPFSTVDSTYSMQLALSTSGSRYFAWRQCFNGTWSPWWRLATDGSPSTIETDTNTAKYLRWKNYGSNHIIIDASNGTAPDGTAINSVDAGTPWAGTYPTLMGWNGNATFGVRVDSARVADKPKDKNDFFLNGLFPYDSAIPNVNSGYPVFDGNAGSIRVNEAQFRQGLFPNINAAPQYIVGVSPNWQSGGVCDLFTLANGMQSYLESLGFSKGGIAAAGITAFGYQAADKFTAASTLCNTCVGNGAGKALLNNPANNNNTLIGCSAGNSLVTGSYNVFIGKGAGLLSTEAHNNTVIGPQGAYFLNGDYNIILGQSSGQKCGGDHNIFMGTSSGSNCAGGYNIFIGRSAAYEFIQGNRNVVIGDQAGRNGVVAYDDSTYIGCMAHPYTINTYNETAIGYNALGHGANSITLGNNQISMLVCAAATISALSDSRLKFNQEIADEQKLLAALKAIPIKRFTFDPDVTKFNDEHRLGFIAQDVQKVFPKSVTVGPDILEPVLDEEGKQKYVKDETGEIPETRVKLEKPLELTQDFAIPVLWGVVQNLVKRVESLEQELQEIKQSKVDATQID